MTVLDVGVSLADISFAQAFPCDSGSKTTSNLESVVSETLISGFRNSVVLLSMLGNFEHTA